MMNFEFPIEELPSVMRRPRLERRRTLVGGSAYWGTIVESEADAGKLRLDDGRLLDADSVSYLPPVSPSKIIAVHISYGSRSMETATNLSPRTRRPTSPNRPTHSTVIAVRS